MEASALPASAGLARARLGLGAPLLRLRSDEQLVSLFRAGNEDAFRVIHDRYRSRMLAYARQMLAASPADAEDAVQEIFVRAYAGLRANRRDLALRAWLYRIAHNRCVDDLRRPHAIAVESVEELGETGGPDPHARVEQRETLARLIADVQRLPEQQRSALLMRELGGMPYADLAGALGVSVPAVKSLLVRARVGLVQASEARDTDCDAIREDLVGAHDRGVRASGRARRHMRDCSECRRFRGEVRGMSRSLGLLIPALGPVAVLAKLAGIGGGGSAAAGSGTGAAAGGGAAVSGCGAAAAGGTAVAATGGAAVGAGASGAALSAGAAAGAGHVAAVVAATVIAAGGAIGIQHAVSSGHPGDAHPRRITALVALPLGRTTALPSATAIGSRAVTTPTVSRSAATAAGAPTVTTETRPLTAAGRQSKVDGASGLSSSVGSSSSAPGDPSTTSTTASSGSEPVSGTPTDTTTSPVTTTTPGTTTGPTTGTSATPISGSSPGTPATTTSTTPAATGSATSPGTATGIVPTVTSTTPATGFGAHPPRHLRLHTSRSAQRGVAPTSSAG